MRTNLKGKAKIGYKALGMKISPIEYNKVDLVPTSQV